MKKTIILALLALPGVGSAAGVAGADVPAKPAAATARARIFLNGASTPGSIDFAQSRTFRQYAEDGRIDTQYSADGGLGFELGFHYRFKRRLGAMLSVATARRDGALSYSTTVPHPLYLDRARQVSGTQEGLSYSETAVHLDFVYSVQSGSLEVLFFAGPSLVDVKTDVISKLDYRDVYPYDEVSVTAVKMTEVGDSGVGFNLGAGLDYRFGKSKRFGFGAQLRYTTASATLAPPEGPAIDVDTGGFQAAVGVRLFF